MLLDESRNEVTQLIWDARESGFTLDQRQLASRVHVEHISDLGLFLYELYQRFHHALPPAGATYSAISQIPGESSGQSDALASALSNADRECEKLKEAVFATMMA